MEVEVISPVKAVANPLIAHFERRFQLSGDERADLDMLPVRAVTIAAGQDVVREGDRPSRCAFLLKGLACSSKVLDQGRRQIMGFHIDGGMPDLLSLHLEMLDSDLQTISRCEFAFVDHAPLRLVCDRHPRLTSALWRATLIDAAVFREWVANIGQRQAPERVAHLFCEMSARMDDVGLVSNGRFALPLTQIQLSEATGLSTVHINRTLQDLRKRQLISFSGGVLTIRRWDAMVELSGFQPDYLHLLPHRQPAH